jgi:hypothetical protein
LVDVEVASRRRYSKQKQLICREIAKPSIGLEPMTASLPSSNEAGTAGKAGKLRARKPCKKKESAEDG